MIENIEQYSKIARLWAIHIEREIEQYGSSVAINGKKYNSIQDLHSDIEIQLKGIIESNEIPMNITYTEALNILIGKNEI